MGASTDTASIDGVELRVERPLTCTICGYPTIREVGALEAETQSTCVHCGEWTVQVADTERLVGTAREIAETLDGDLFTERQLLAYLLRDVLGVSRRTAAKVMESSASNVDNLQRRARSKVEEANRLVAVLEELADAED